MHFRYSLVFVCLTPVFCLPHILKKDYVQNVRSNIPTFGAHDEFQKGVPFETKSKSLKSDRQNSYENNIVALMLSQTPSAEAINNDTLSKVPKPDYIVKRIKQLLGFEQVFTPDLPLNENFTVIKDIAKTAKQTQSKSESAEEVKERIREVGKNESIGGNLSLKMNQEFMANVENSSNSDVTKILINENGIEQMSLNGSKVSNDFKLETDVKERNTDYQQSDTIQIGQIDNTSVIPKEEDIIEAANFGMQAMNDLYYIKEPNLYIKGLFLEADNPARYVAAFNDQTEEARKLARFGYASIEAAKAFRRKYPEISRQGSFVSLSQGTDLHKQCPKRGIPQCTPASLRYRTADGSCNNNDPKNIWWGSSMSAMSRFMPPVYQDGIESPRLSVNGGPLPSPRDVSNFFHEERDVPLAFVTHMLMQWGQFVDHDITATGQSRGFNGTVPRCCLRGGAGFQPPEFMHPECLPIAVSEEDTFYGRLGVRCLEFLRSGPAPNEGCEFGPREQLTQVTSFLDASTVYSSNIRQSDSLRLFRNGLLQYGRLQARMPVLPRDNSDLCRRGTLSTSCFKAGDGRLSEQPALTSLHIIFLRLHNRIATQLAAINQHWKDEKLYQETRKIVGAIIQHITYREFLPIVLGPEVMKIFDLEILRSGYYIGYDPNVNPNVANEFSTAAYRFGHSLVQNSFVRFDKAHCTILNNVSIHEEFSNPANLHSAGALDKIILGLINQPSQKRDEFIASELTNHLFQTPRFAFGMDLASLNIQRGRDHGIAPYVQWRVPCELSPIKTWEDLELATSTGAMQKFRTLYASIEDVDLFPAGLAEKPLKGALVGPTFGCIIAQQFSNLRKGDRFWFENPHIENSFTLTQLQQIRHITLSQVLCRTMDNVENVQPFVMLAADNRKNQRRSCHDRSLSVFNIDHWIESEFTEFKNTPLQDTTDELEEDEQSIIINGETNSRASYKSNEQGLTNKKFQNLFTKPPNKNQEERQPPVRSRPLKTKINQQNRIAVKRPLGPGENVTIFVQNNAVNAPIFINNAHVSGSTIHINQMSTSTSKPDYQPIPKPSVNQQPSDPTTNVNIKHNTNPYPAVQIPKPISKPQIDNSKPYIPYNFNDPNNPNPPHYGYSANPANNYIPNNFYFYNMLKSHFHNQYPPNLHFGQSLTPDETYGYNPHFIHPFFNQPNRFDKNSMQNTEAGENRFSGWINNSSSTDRIEVQQDHYDQTYVHGRHSTEGYSSDGESIIINSPTNEKQSSMYRFDVLLNEQKSTIEELIQHTQLPLNPIGIIESDTDDKNADDEKIEGGAMLREENFDINKGVRLKEDEEEKIQKQRDADWSRRTGVHYFDRSVLKKYPEIVINSTIDRIAYKNRVVLMDQVLGSECLNKTCRNIEDGEDSGLSDENSKNKIFADKIIEEIINDERTTPLIGLDFNVDDFDFLTEKYPKKENIDPSNINRFSESENSVEDTNYMEMPILNSEQSAITTELPKPMKLNLYLF